MAADESASAGLRRLDFGRRRIGTRLIWGWFDDRRN